jgi:type IV pilus assembly protein PilF
MLRVCFLLSLLVVSACSSNSSKVKIKQASLYFSSGTQSLLEQDYTQALTALLKANELSPNNSEILNNLGMAYYFKGEQDLAVRHLTHSLEIDDTNSDARVNLASIYYSAGKFNEAERLYKDVAKDLTYDKQARNLYNLGLLEMQHKKDLVGAESYFKRSLKEDGTYCPSYYQLGLIQFERRQFNGALKNFKEASSGTCYDSPAPHYYQALTFVELGKFDEARIKFDEIDSRFKKSAFAVKARAKSLELNNFEKRRTIEAHNRPQRALETPEF